MAFCLSVSLRADAARRRVVLVRPDETFSHAVMVALSSWDIDVTLSDAASLGADVPQAQPRADALARSLGADAVAWVEVTAEGAVLFVYDAGEKQLSSRVLDAPPPVDDARAAAVALSLKTVLRSSVVAPETERFGAGALPPPPDTLRVEILVGYRAIPTNVNDARGALGVAFWPRLFEGHLGAGLDVGTDLGASVGNGAFSGSVEDLTYTASLRARTFLSPHFVLEPALVATLHDSEIEGTVRVTGTPVEVDYTDFSLGLMLTGELRLGAFGLGLYAGGDRMLRYQSYVARGNLVVDGSPWLAEGGLRLSLGVL